MDFVSGNYFGLSIDDYNTLKEFDAFAYKWAKQFEKLPAGNGEVYVLKDEKTEFLEYLEELEDEGVKLKDGLTWFTYVRSTNRILGF